MKKTIIIVSIVLTLCGSFFASYDMFVFFNKLNNKLFPLCHSWESIIEQIEPYTMHSRTPIQNMKPFFILKSTEGNFPLLLNIIKMNKTIVIKEPVTQVVISVPTIDSGTRLGGYVYLNNIEGKNEFVSSPDIMIQWIKNFRHNWFLKWGLILIAIGAFLNLLNQLNVIPKTGGNNMGEKILKQKIGLVFILISAAISAIAMVFYDMRSFYRFLICLTFGTLGIGLRAAFYTIIFKGVSDSSAEIGPIARSYLYYYIMLMLVSCLLYLIFYNLIVNMAMILFLTLSSLMFICIGLVIKTIIDKFGLKLV